MLVLVLPNGRTVSHWEPSLVEAKRLSNRIAVFSLLYPASEANSSVELVWSLAPFTQTLDLEVESLNLVLLLLAASARHPPTTDG